jgi:hypothetical protein
VLAWDIRQGRLIEEPTEPKLTAMANSRADSTIRRESSGSPVVKLTTDRSPDVRGSPDGRRRQRREENLFNLWMSDEEIRDPRRRCALALDAQRQRLHPPQQQPAVEWRQPCPLGFGAQHGAAEFQHGGRGG